MLLKREFIRKIERIFYINVCVDRVCTVDWGDVGAIKLILVKNDIRRLILLKHDAVQPLAPHTALSLEYSWIWNL